jgi:hypothetical protein
MTLGPRMDEQLRSYALSSAKTCVWRLVNGIGCERAQLSHEGNDWVLRGRIIRIAEHGPTEVDYAVFCDPKWRTRSAKISLSDRTGERSLDLTSENGTWSQNGLRLSNVEGCLDIDLEWSPSTNTLPIRRLNLSPGRSSGRITAAWVRFPELRVEPLEQSYECLTGQAYIYRSHGGAFRARISVDADKLVVDYEGLWRREEGIVRKIF